MRNRACPYISPRHREGMGGYSTALNNVAHCSCACAESQIQRKACGELALSPSATRLIIWSACTDRSVQSPRLARAASK
jgi:hypothetical protein